MRVLRAVLGKGRSGTAPPFQDSGREVGAQAEGGRALKLLSRAVVTAPTLPQLKECLDNALRHMDS